jgi:phospholipid/cholesterol/gamma-HCH transport system substrate-binding protein
LKEISDRLAKGEGTLGKLLSEDDQVYADLAATLASFRGMSESIAKGEGTIGKLVSDEELYDEFKALVREGRAAVDDIRETSPVTTFTSIFFGAF